MKSALKYLLFAILNASVIVSSASTVTADLKSTTLRNPAPFIPPQCYTKTVGTAGTVHNTCFTCHTNGFRPDFINDRDLQLEYAFPAEVEKNHWTNLFQDRGQQVAALSDQQILAYVRTSNYFDSNGSITLAKALTRVPAAWDHDADGQWSGYVPDSYFNFDDEGFDRDPSGAYTGWRALAYYPFPSTHWPTNGSFDDVLIRLPQAFRMQDNQFDITVYKLNLAILEALIKKRDIDIPPVDENAFDVDLDKDGMLDMATRVVYDWAPTEGRYMHFVGDAFLLQRQQKVRLAAGLFPVGTEFLNTLRYIDIAGDGAIRPAPRLKEIRYAQKMKWLTYAELETLAMNEIKERNDFPDRLKLPIGNLEDGLSNGKGWVLQGFIEDAAGRLRPQSFEETASCIGCHGGIGATIDSTFSLARKLDGSTFQRGWYHWSQKDLRGIKEPRVEFMRAGTQYEYCFYLMYTNGGDEYRANTEVTDLFFDSHGHLKKDMAEKLHDDISILLYPSPQRALALNKTYKLIVAEQSFRRGREAIVGSAEKVHAEILLRDLETRVKTAIVANRLPHFFAGGPDRSPAAPSVSTLLQAVISGEGMAGPSGERYQINWSGLIDKSTYGLEKKGFYFPFPPRHTLPTRIIVPNAAIPSCYACHRLTAPMPPKDPQVSIPIQLPASSSVEAGLNLVRLTKDSGIDTNGVWSPDGNRIAWVSDRSGGFQIWVMQKDGADKRQLTQGPGIHGWPMWHPDSTRLVYWGYDEQGGVSTISTCRIDGSAGSTLVESKEALDRPVWRPDGNTIAYAAQRSGNWDIWVMAGDGSRQYQMTYDAQMETNPLWSPDGMIIAYKVAPSKAYNLTIENFISVRNGFDSPTYRLWDGIKSIQMNDWSPDGKKIAYTAEIVTNASGTDRVSYLAVVDEVSFVGRKTAGKPLIFSQGRTLGDRGPVFSPAGDQVAFWAWDKSYRATLWLADADGKNLKRLTSEGFDMYPRWHPNGKSILFESGRSGNMDIWLLSLR